MKHLARSKVLRQNLEREIAAVESELNAVKDSDREAHLEEFKGALNRIIQNIQ
jgi:hypothetical protein